MNKNIQTSKLIIPKVINENNRNFQSLFNPIQYDGKNQNQTTSMINDNYEPLQLL
jgi:hypothetical protein